MTTIISGSSPSVTFSDSTSQNTSAIVGGKVPYANMPVGSVLQVVNFITNSQTTSTNGTYVATPLTASITPKFSSSKILILVSGNSFTGQTSGQISLELYKNGSDLAGVLSQAYNTAGGQESQIGFNYLDSPTTTSSTTYTVYMANTTATGTVSFPINSSATITLMEIAA